MAAQVQQAGGGGASNGGVAMENPGCLPPSSRVKIVGTSREDLNGAFGTVESYDEARERYTLNIDTAGSSLALKEKNLILIDPAPGPTAAEEGTGNIAASSENELPYEPNLEDYDAETAYRKALEFSQIPDPSDEDHKIVVTFLKIAADHGHEVAKALLEDEPSEGDDIDIEEDLVALHGWSLPAIADLMAQPSAARQNPAMASVVVEPEPLIAPAAAQPLTNSAAEDLPEALLLTAPSGKSEAAAVNNDAGPRPMGPYMDGLASFRRTLEAEDPTIIARIMQYAAPYEGEDQLLLRYFRGGKTNPKLAMQLLQECLQWREERGILGYRSCSPEVILENDPDLVNGFLSHGVIGRDFSRRPVVYKSYANFRESTVKPITMAQLIQYEVWMLERLVMQLPEGVQDFVFILDLSGTGWDQLSPKSVGCPASIL